MSRRPMQNWRINVMNFAPPVCVHVARYDTASDNLSAEAQLRSERCTSIPEQLNDGCELAPSSQAAAPRLRN